MYLDLINFIIIYMINVYVQRLVRGIHSKCNRLNHFETVCKSQLRSIERSDDSTDYFCPVVNNVNNIPVFHGSKIYR